MSATKPPAPDDDGDDDDESPPVAVMIADVRWGAAGLEGLARAAAAATLARLGLDADAHIATLLATDDAEVAGLNAQFRGKPAPTNVLSWPARELAAAVDGAAPARPAPDPFGGPAELGDIALAYETCAAEAAAAGRPLADHATHLVVHGLLHLLGYDHTRPADAALMEGLEVEILANLGVANPYDPPDE